MNSTEVYLEARKDIVGIWREQMASVCTVLYSKEDSSVFFNANCELRIVDSPVFDRCPTLRTVGGGECQFKNPNSTFKNSI
jgi:hypothetical protein